MPTVVVKFSTPIYSRRCQWKPGARVLRCPRELLAPHGILYHRQHRRGEPSLSDVESDPLPPSGRLAGAALDPEIAAMLARAAGTVGVEWHQPSPPEPSHLDDWYFGSARTEQTQPPVPFFPEIHEELTRSWKNPFPPGSSRISPHHPRRRGR